jgi:hypothetical protein
MVGILSFLVYHVLADFDSTHRISIPRSRRSQLSLQCPRIGYPPHVKYAGSFVHKIQADKDAEYDEMTEIVSLSFLFVQLLSYRVHRTYPSLNLVSTDHSFPILRQRYLNSPKNARETFGPTRSKSLLLALH